MGTRQTFSRKQRRRARGVQTIELIVAVPILFIAFIAVVQYGVQTLIQQAITQAATVAAREAAKGADLNQVLDAVDTILAPHNIVISNTAGSLTEVILETSDNSAITTSSSYGDPGLGGSPPSTALAANEARVTVCIGLTKSPFINALPSVGFDTTGKFFRSALL
jgi:Flp pilus assembly protein TadG